MRSNCIKMAIRVKAVITSDDVRRLDSSFHGNDDKETRKGGNFFYITHDWTYLPKKE